MRLALAALAILGCLVGCGAASEPEPTKASFEKKPKPEGFGPGGGAPLTNKSGG